MTPRAAVRVWREMQTVCLSLHRCSNAISVATATITVAPGTYTRNHATCGHPALVSFTSCPRHVARGRFLCAHNHPRGPVLAPALCLAFRHDSASSTSSRAACDETRGDVGVAGVQRGVYIDVDVQAAEAEHDEARRLADVLMGGADDDYSAAMPAKGGDVVHTCATAHPTPRAASTRAGTQEEAKAAAVSGNMGGGNGNDRHTYYDKHSSDRHCASEDRASAEDVIVRVLRLHNLPRGWMHEDIMHFIDSVAAHAGIHAAASSHTRADGRDDENSDQDEESESALPRAQSVFLHRVIVPFGRRTGLVYGTPLLYVNTHALADYLLHHLRFDADDYRNRIYFTEEEGTSLHSVRGRRHGSGRSEGGAVDASQREGARAVRNRSDHSSSDYTHHHNNKNEEDNATSAWRDAPSGSSPSSFYVEVEDSIAQEQEEMLSSLELDRYLMAPDLMLDIAKMHQQRYVTRGGKVVLDAFIDGEEDRMGAEDEEDESEGGGRKGGVRRRRARRGDDGETVDRRVVAQKSLGRGSMHNMPIPKPYVEGRRI